MIFVNLEQRTPAWFAWRLNGITATESPMIAGLSPYCSAWHLWGEKCGKLKPHEVSEFAVRNGVRFESTALELWNQKHDEFALPACCEWETDRKYRASCDGLPMSGRPVEIKCFGKEHLAEIGAKGLEAPCIQHCIMQVHHQILVTDADRGSLVFYDPDCEEKIHEFVIHRDEQILKGIRARGDEFWEYVVSGKEPPYKRDVYFPKGDDRETWARLANEYRESEALIASCTAEIEKRRQRMDEIRASLDKMLPQDQSRAEFGGVVVTRSRYPGPVDYKQAWLDLPENVRQSVQSLDRFRRPDVVRFNVRSTDAALPEDVLDESLVNPLVMRPQKRYWF